MSDLRRALLEQRAAGRLVELYSPLTPHAVYERLAQLAEEGNVDPPVQLPRQRTYGRVRLWIIDSTFRLAAAGMFTTQQKPEWFGTVRSDGAGSRIIVRVATSLRTQVTMLALGAWMCLLLLWGGIHGGHIFGYAVFMGLVLPVLCRALPQHQNGMRSWRS
jgi:hypothetical protein